MMTVPYHFHGCLGVLTLALLFGACAPLDRKPATDKIPDSSSTAPPGTPFATPWLETDAVVTLNNEELGRHFQSAIMALDPIEGLSLREVAIGFSDDSIALSIAAQIQEADSANPTIHFSGDIVLSFSGVGLGWFPRVSRLSTEPPDAAVDAERWLERANAHLTRHLVVHRENDLGIRLQPPGTLTLNARLPETDSETLEQRFDLPGAFTVAASRTRVEASHTTIALDLEFVEALSYCPADFSISRATFAGRVINREPGDVGRELPADATEWHYFTEVSDARRNLTLVHYWFADGRPIGITELAVEPSARWRTWSSLPITPGTARHIEVFAADRDSGCIVDAAHIRLAPGGAIAGAGRDAGFDDLVGGFPAARERPRVANVEYSTRFLSEALDAAFGGRTFTLRFEAVVVPRQSLSGYLGSMADAEFDCQWRDCEVPTECVADFSRCERQQDTRQCTTCLFRNPLNNRCMSERVDQECEARKARANARYESAWEACMAREESNRAACERQSREAVATCREKGKAFMATCERNREVLDNRTEPLARIGGEAHAEGRVALRFSGLSVMGDLGSLKGQLRVESDLEVNGGLQFEPSHLPDDLSQCLAGWSSKFQARIDRPQAPRRLAGEVLAEEGGLQVSWPGMTLPLSMNRAPLEALLTSRPELHADCSLGLTPAQLDARVSGDDGVYLRGILPLDVQPGTARVDLPGMTAQINGHDHEAVAKFKQGLLRYELLD